MNGPYDAQAELMMKLELVGRLLAWILAAPSAVSMNRRIRWANRVLWLISGHSNVLPEVSAP